MEEDHPLHGPDNAAFRGGLAFSYLAAAFLRELA